MDPIAAAKDGELLLERDAELELLRDALERLCDGHGSAVLIDGSAGIGKTSLLAAATDLASEAPVQLRAARAGRLEREMPFVVARQLLEPVIERSSEDERSRLLEGAAALALVALGGAGSGEGAVGDPFAPIHGLYWLLANLAESEPVVLVVDDVHWVDGRSLRWLDFVARRASDTGVLLLAAARTGEAEEPPELEALRADARSVLHPSPLSRAAVEQLIAAAFDAELPAGLSDACSTATGGNPFLLAELLRGLRSSNTTDAVRTIAESATSLTTDTLARSVQSRIEPFGGDAIELARAIAVLRGAPQLRHVAKLAGLSEDRVSELADRLRVAEILAPGHPIDFVHPLVRASVYEGLSEEARSRAHRRAAEVLSSMDGGARDAAAHLVKCAPNGDSWVVDRLREAAREAMAAGAPDAARRYLERALAEPPADDVAVSFELGHALRGASPFEAPDVLVSVAERAEDPELRLRAIADAALAYLDCANHERSVHWTQRLVETLPADRTEELLAAEADLFCLNVLRVGRRPDDSARIAATVEKAGDVTRGELLARQALALDRAIACAPVGEVVGLASPPPPPPWAGRGLVPGVHCKVLAMSGEWDLAREAAVRGWESALSTGLLHTSSYRESYLSEIDRLAGRLIDSEAHARTAWDIVADLAPVSIPAWSAFTNLLATLIARGEIGEAGELADRRDLSAPFSVVPMTPVPLEVRGTLKLAQGDLGGGAADLLTVGEDLEEMRWINPAPIPWRQEVVPALSALGRTAEALQIVGEGEKRARAYGAPHAIGAMLRARSSLEAKSSRFETLRESIAILEATGPPHELARSYLEFGAALRRDGQRRDSREPLRKALELAHTCGAEGLAGRAREELAAAGSRPRSVFRTGVESLTASELRTARMAADGFSNVEIAQRLFVTKKTIEKHLSNAYTKLEIASRRDLPKALSGVTSA